MTFPDPYTMAANDSYFWFVYDDEVKYGPTHT